MLVSLTQGLVAFIDDEDASAVCKFKWCAQRPGPTALPYAVTFVGRKRIPMQNVVLGVPAGVVVDHVDGDALNNRRGNLRVATVGQNNANAKLRSDNTSGFKGVSRVKHLKRLPWEAYIQVDGKFMRLGRYETPEEAAEAYDKAAVAHFGSYARTNAMMRGAS